MPASVSNRLVIALAQIPAIVGDIAGNRDRLRKARKEAAAFGADIVMAPELYLSGYPPEDLVLKPAFQEACRAACEELARETADGGPAALVGLPWVEDGKLYNAMALLDGGRIEAVRFKVDLPNYGVFDEKRVFAPGPSPGPIVFRGVRVGVPICEDIWGPDPVECILETGGEILLVPNASPYERDKLAMRQNVAVARVVESGLPLIYLNMVGGQDELAFDGGSFALNADRTLARNCPPSARMVARTVWERGESGWRCVEGPREVVEEGDEADYAACVMGLRDYVENNRFPGVVLGLSGGVDSALCAAMAVDALGPERVHAVMLPYRFTSNESLSDAAACAKALGLRYDIVPIAEPVEGVERALKQMFAGKPRDITEENIQSRARGLILMAISNKTGAMVVTTGNKSEMSVGYATLYGDMNGGFNPIKDLYKMEVFRLVRLAQSLEAGRRARAGWRGDPRKHHRQAAERGIAREPEGRGFAAALSGARRHSARPRRKGDARRRHRRGGLRPGDGAQRSSACSISPNTSAASRRRGSRWGRRISAATGAIRSSTASATRALAAQKPDASIAPLKSTGTSERFEE